jgi:hypothetical protein
MVSMAVLCLFAVGAVAEDHGRQLKMAISPDAQPQSVNTLTAESNIGWVYL